MTTKTSTTVELPDEYPGCDYCLTDDRTTTQTRAYPAVYHVKTNRDYGNACIACTNALSDHAPNSFCVVNGILPDDTYGWPLCTDCKSTDSSFIRSALYRVFAADEFEYLCEGCLDGRGLSPASVQCLIDQPAPVQ